MKPGTASRLGNHFSHSDLILCCEGAYQHCRGRGVQKQQMGRQHCLHFQWNTWRACCTDRGCKGTWQGNNGPALAMRKSSEVSQSVEDTHSLQLTSKKQSERCYVVPEARWSSLSMCLQCMTIMRSLVQDKLKRENKWLLGYRRELTEIEYFRNFWLLKCFLKIPLLPSYIPQFLHQGYCIIIHLLV